MERKNSRSVFLKKKHVFSGNMCFRMCFRMLALDSVLESCLRRVRDLEKNTFSGFRFGILPPAGQRSQKKHVPGKRHAYIAHIRPYSPISAHIGPYRPHIGPYSRPAPTMAIVVFKFVHGFPPKRESRNCDALVGTFIGRLNWCEQITS